MAKNKKDKNADEDDKDGQDDFACSDFLVADSNALIVTLKADIFESIKESPEALGECRNEARGFTLMAGINSPIYGVVFHPT